MELKPTYLGTMLSLATVAFGFIAASAWNKAIGDIIAVWLKPGTGAIAEVVYALIVTIIAVAVIQNLAKIAERDIGPKV